MAKACHNMKTLTREYALSSMNNNIHTVLEYFGRVGPRALRFVRIHSETISINFFRSGQYWDHQRLQKVKFSEIPFFKKKCAISPKASVGRRTWEKSIALEPFFRWYASELIYCQRIRLQRSKNVKIYVFEKNVVFFANKFALGKLV